MPLTDPLKTDPPQAARDDSISRRRRISDAAMYVKFEDVLVVIHDEAIDPCSILVSDTKLSIDMLSGDCMW